MLPRQPLRSMRTVTDSKTIWVMFAGCVSKASPSLGNYLGLAMIPFFVLETGIDAPMINEKDADGLSDPRILNQLKFIKPSDPRILNQLKFIKPTSR